MTDNINKLSQMVESSKTTATLANLTDQDVMKIWDSVSNYIESFLKQSKGVVIPGFGTFSFIQKRLDVGNKKFLLVQRPVFVLSEKVVQNHGLRTTHYPVNGSIPVHPLNYFSIQQQSNYSRDQIEQCVKHVLQVFHRSIGAQRNVEFTFSRIGKLQIRENKAKMRFFKDFIQSVDENAARHLIESMCNRPQTCDSVMSEHEAMRPATSSNVVLPRLNSRIGNPSMQSIREEENDEDNEKNVRSTGEINSDDLKLPPLTETSAEESESQSIYHVKTTGPTENPIPIASLFSSVDLVAPATRRSTNHSALGLTRSKSSMERRTTRDHCSASISSCGHYGTGDELCHLCSQRAKRNIPVFLHEEKRLRQENEEKLLEEYRHQKELEEKKREEEKLKTAREEKQRTAAFNFGIAEAKRAKKLERPQTTDVQRSIIFRKRTRTPPHYLRQQDLARQLEIQMKTKKDEEQNQRKDKDFLERLEQIQLAESLVQQRETYLKNKRSHQTSVKNALDEQMRTKPNELPQGEPDSPYFGMNDMTKEKFHQRRLQAMELVRQQREVIEQRQRKELFKQIDEQNYESNVLKSIKDDFIDDTRQRHDRALKIRRDLEKNWSDAAEEKHKRDEDEREHLFAPQGLLLHEQCDQYKRCAQCQRNLKNRGETHFWKDTRYIPGTHIIV